MPKHGKPATVVCPTFNVSGLRWQVLVTEVRGGRSALRGDRGRAEADSRAGAPADAHDAEGPGGERVVAAEAAEARWR